MKFCLKRLSHIFIVIYLVQYYYCFKILKILNLNFMGASDQFQKSRTVVFK